MKAGQRGAAVLTAMLVVVLVATLAAGMLWQQWRSFEAESAQRTRAQANWILTGALDWARLILREDARQDATVDTLSEPWSVPLAPARLSTFLAAESGQALADDDQDAISQTFLAGRIEDLQARLNVANLLEGDKASATGLAVWTRLFKHLNLPERELQALVLGLMQANSTTATDAGASVPLLPTTVAELGLLGLSPSTLQTLAPFITVFMDSSSLPVPVSTKVNLNTAPAEVLLASVSGLDMAQAQALVQLRATRPMKALSDVAQLLNNPNVKVDAQWLDVKTQYFGVTGMLKVGQSVLQERSVLRRDGLEVKTVSRVREVVTPDFAHLQ